MNTIFGTAGRKGVITVEVITGMAILGVVAALAADAVAGYYRVKSQYDWRRAAVWAAAGQLHRYQAGTPLDAPPPENLWAKSIRLETAARPGRDAWEGFQLVTVTATLDVKREPTIHEQVSGYVRERAMP